MKWFERTVGRRLAFRLYFYLAILSLLIAAIAAGVARLVVEPALQAARRDGMAWLAEDMLLQRNSPELLGRRLNSARDRAGVNITLFAPDGRVLATNIQPAATPLDTSTLDRLAKEGVLTLPEDAFAIGHVEADGIAAYAVMKWRGVHQSAWWGRLVVILATLGLLGLASFVLARALVQPLERLAKVTQEFGLGKLRTRASTDRPDEIGDLGRAFNEMADRIEHLRRAEKELLANVSHELRTPLARIRVVVELAASGGDPARTQRHLSAIAEDLTEVEQLLGDIITAARLDLGNEHSSNPYPPLRVTPVRLAPVLEGLVGLFQEVHPEREVRTTMDRDVTLSIDRVMFKHALSNVLDNAHKYSPPGSPIDVALRRDLVDGGRAVVEIRDYGRGIDSSDVPHVFTAFFRADRSRARGTGGVGLGLTLARRIVEAHSGTIQLESRPGEGTTVTIDLPARVAKQS